MVDADRSQWLANFDLTITRLMQVPEPLRGRVVALDRSETIGESYSLTLSSRRGGLSFAFKTDGSVGWRYAGRIATADEASGYKFVYPDSENDNEAFIVARIAELLERLERPGPDRGL